jgi:hypothetical protein
MLIEGVSKFGKLVSRTGAELRKKLGAGEVKAADASAVRASAPSNPEATGWIMRDRALAEAAKSLICNDRYGRFRVNEYSEHSILVPKTRLRHPDRHRQVSRIDSALSGKR